MNRCERNCDLILYLTMKISEKEADKEVIERMHSIAQKEKEAVSENK